MFDKLFNFVLKKSCPLCDRATSETFCLDCQRRLDRDRFSHPAQFWQDQPRVFVWGNYTDTLKRTISRLKYDRHPELATPLGEALARSWLEASLTQNKLAIVPIPMHSEKQQQRGYNQAELISRAFCNITGDLHQPSGLQRIRATEALFNLSPRQREQTLSQVFEIGKICRDRQVLLIDDIYTTGATARAAIQVLHRHQIRVLGVAVVAKPSWDVRREARK
ncbi:MAG: ComF family protein [Plectolyngbya sp. WJT66-NPBG17]|jgi:ComF family protein|nr:ComF family protein [Plectolyngbya sp. WJT66-NPBG17]MBW4523720.1 ComF family protein [Phormidium tanganyikae FI6-MK23]